LSSPSSAGSAPDSTAAPPSPVGARLLRVVRTPRSPRLGYLSRRRLPGRPARAPEPPPLEPHAPEILTTPPPWTLAVAAAAQPRSTSRVAPGGEHHAGAVRVDPAPSVASCDLAGVSTPRRRVDRPRRRISAANVGPASFACSRASCRCRPRANPSPGTLHWVRRRAPPPLRRRAPPSPAGRRRFGRLRKILAVGLKSDAPDQPRCPQATAAIRSRSNGSGSSQLESAGQPYRWPWQFCRKAPEFPIFTKIPFHLRSFLTV
jgi:hypothetical protein